MFGKRENLGGKWKAKTNNNNNNIEKTLGKCKIKIWSDYELQKREKRRNKEMRVEKGGEKGERKYGGEIIK